MRVCIKMEREGTKIEEHHKEESIGLVADWIGKMRIRWDKDDAMEQWLSA